MANISQLSPGVLYASQHIRSQKQLVQPDCCRRERDEEVVIARNGIPVAKLVKYTANKVAPPGAWKGRTAYTADWNSAETNAEVEQLFTDSNNAPAA